ncbi:MAG: hypothetical protein MUO21_03165 [Nitrososphaeraceae archaeon]|nr:hypothetical protein [Nitrososphaeraceae archaeon]
MQANNESAGCRSDNIYFRLIFEKSKKNIYFVAIDGTITNQSKFYYDEYDNYYIDYLI